MARTKVHVKQGMGGSRSGRGRSEKTAVLKGAYALRSKFVHRGHTTIDDLDTVRTFMINTWALFLAFAQDIRRFDTKDALIDHLERMKYSS